MSTPRRASLLLLPLALASVVSARHEDDPKLWSLRPPHHGRPVRSHLAPGQNIGFAGAPRAFASNGVRLLSQIPLTTFGASSGNDCWGYTSSTGREIAIIGHSDGAGFVDISNPNSPVVLLNAAGPNSLWRDVKVFGDYAYVVSEGGSGIQVFNLSNVDNGVVTQLPSVTTGGVTSTHNVAIDTTSGYLYRCGGGSNVGLRIYDLNANPASPTLVGQWLNLYVHDVQVVTYTSGPYAGKQIGFACSGTGNGSGATRLSILDLTNKTNITVIREVFWPGAAYSHQCWVSEDLNYCYVDDELDEPNVPTTTYVVDISTLATANLVGSFTNGNTAIGHNLYVKGDQIFQANYRSGLRVFDRTNPVQCTEQYFFDTFPGDDAAQFNGLWSVYPYFQSGVVIGSDLESGLFVWWVGDPLLDVQLTQSAPALISPAGMTIPALITENQAGVLVAGTERLNYDAGAGLVSVPLTNTGVGTYDVTFPALNCGIDVAWYLSAESTNGLTWTYPENGASGPAVSTVAYSSQILTQLDMETAAGWAVGDASDNATSGVWTRVDPNGTAAQPEDDHSVTGASCWVTGNASAGSSVGTADVDNGTTTLTTAAYNLASYSDPVIGYWRWYSNNQNGVVDDTFYVQVSNGGMYVTVETIGPGHPESTGGWFYHEFHVNQFVAPSSTVRVRFRASDLGTGSIVEAAIDDFIVREVDCSTLVTYCTAGTTSNGCVASISSSGTPSASAATNFAISVSNVEGQKSGLVFYGVNGQQALAWNGGTSYMCVRAPTQRSESQVTGGTAGACDGAMALDWNVYLAGHPNALGTPFSAGSIVWMQAWFRDPPSPGTTSLSNALRFTVGP